VLESSQFSRALSNIILIYRTRRQFAADRRQFSGLFGIQEDCEVVFVTAESDETDLSSTPTDLLTPTLGPQYLEVDCEHDGNSNTPDGMGIAASAVSHLEDFNRVPSLEENLPQFFEVEAPGIQVLPTRETEAAAARLDGLHDQDARPFIEDISAPPQASTANRAPSLDLSPDPEATDASILPAKLAACHSSPSMLAGLTESGGALNGSGGESHESEDVVGHRQSGDRLRPLEAPPEEPLAVVAAVSPGDVSPAESDEFLCADEEERGEGQVAADQLSSAEAAGGRGGGGGGEADDALGLALATSPSFGTDSSPLWAVEEPQVTWMGKGRREGERGGGRARANASTCPRSQAPRPRKLFY